MANIDVVQGYVFRSTRLIVRVRAAYTQSLLTKTLRIRFNSEPSKPDGKTESNVKEEKNDKEKPEVQQTKVGLIYNLMSSDLETLVNARDLFLLIGMCPIQIIFAIVSLVNL